MLGHLVLALLLASCSAHYRRNPLRSGDSFFSNPTNPASRNKRNALLFSSTPSTKSVFRDSCSIVTTQESSKASTSSSLFKTEKSRNLMEQESLPRIRLFKTIIDPHRAYSGLGEALSDTSTGNSNEFASGSSHTDETQETRSSSETSSRQYSNRRTPYSIDEEVDLCERFNRRLMYRGEYVPARPHWMKTGDFCKEFQFRLMDELGKGAHGVVYKAIHQGSGKRVALKYIMPPKEYSKWTFLRMEECLQDRLSDHPSFTKHYCTFKSKTKHPGYWVLAMEYVAGATDLWEYIYDREWDATAGEWKAVNLYDESFIAQVAVQLIGALWFMHKMSVLYRDLKPENILIREDGTVKLIDFGLSSDPSKPCHLSHNRMLGTPYYFPPEYFVQRRPRYARPESDWYALGITLFEMAFRDGPFSQGPEVTFEQLTDQISRGFVCLPDIEGKGVNLCDLVNRLCGTIPEKRLGLGEDSFYQFVTHPFLVEYGIDEILGEANYIASKLGKA